MYKLIIGALLVIILGLSLVLLVQDDPGVLIVKYDEHTIQTTLAFGVGVIIIAMLAISYTWKFARVFLHMPNSVKRRAQNRRFERSRRLLNQGLIDLAEGRFEQAERNLIKLVDFSESPLLHYLAAARAAQLQGKHDERDAYLKAAHEARPEAEIAIGVTQAELQLAHQQTEQALASLSHLRLIAPRHNYVLMLLARAYYELEDWQQLVEVLPEVRNKKLIADHRLKKMELAGYQGMLDIIAATGNASALEKGWYKIPRSLQTEPILLLRYFKLANRLDANIESAENLLVRALENRWNDELIDLYGQFNANDTEAQLIRTEKWLVDYSHNENLLLALGRICVRARLWGKAQGYLEASIGLRPTPANCLVLAELFSQHLKDKEKAAGYYQMGLELSLSDKS